MRTVFSGLMEPDFSVYPSDGDLRKFARHYLMARKPRDNEEVVVSDLEIDSLVAEIKVGHLVSLHVGLLFIA